MSSLPTQELLEELARSLGPKGFTQDPQAMAPWLQDWRQRYQGAAAAMLSPASLEEVARIVTLCSSARVALVPQGGNSSLAGGATPDSSGGALLLSLRRMNAIRDISAESSSAICEAGVILATLHEAAEAVDRRFPLSLGARGSATVGGLISTNAGGTQVLRFGTMRGLVQGIEAVLPDGSVFNGLVALKKDNRGYDLRQLLIGAEGTLGVVTAANLKLVPAIARRCVAWVGLASPMAALRLLRMVEASTGDAVESFELMPAAGLALVLAHIPNTRAPLERSHEWNVLIEATAAAGGPDVESELAAALEAALTAGLIEDVVIAANEAQAQALWQLRETLAEAERVDGPATKHDISVAIEAMPEFIVSASAAVERRFDGARIIAFGHLGDGNVHFNVRPPEGAGADWLANEGREVTGFVHDLVTDAGGSISAEHGIGQSRLAELQRLGDPARLRAMAAIKHALDPYGIMNPGKLVPLAEAEGAP